ncbi:MAG: hypothetical protein HDS11_02775 [Bacteroides sp.]|nr:hypothetical protein [Bacteroides sp.]
MQNEITKYYLEVAIPLIAIIIFEIYLFIKTRKTSGNERVDKLTNIFFKFGIEALFLSIVALIIPLYVYGMLNKIGETGQLTGQIFMYFGKFGVLAISILFLSIYFLYKWIILSDESASKKDSEQSHE